MVARVTAVLTIIIATINKIKQKTYSGGWSKAAGRVCFMDLQIKHITTILTHRTNIKIKDDKQVPDTDTNFLAHFLILQR